MIHIFHGDNLVASRNELNELKTKHKNQELVILEGKILSLTQLTQALQSQSLFTISGRLVVIENLFTKKLKLPSNERQEFINVIKEARDAEIAIWEEKELTKTLLNQFPESTDISLHKFNRMLFQFLDALKPNSTIQILDLFNDSLINDKPELIFALLTRQLRLLIMAKDIGKQIPDLSPWQITKILKQAQYFSMEQLIQLYQHLFEIDIKIKSGQTPYNLIDELKLFLVEI